MKKHLILAIDDDIDDVDMLREAFKTLKTPFELLVAHDGIEALNTLNELKQKGILPCLIVLDINMPRMDGRETFNAIKNDSAFANIATVIFSTSSSALDKMFFERKKAEYFVKPINFKRLLQVASTFLSICEGKYRNEQQKSS